MNPLRVIPSFIVLCGKDVGKICVAVVSLSLLSQTVQSTRARACVCVCVCLFVCLFVCVSE